VLNIQSGIAVEIFMKSRYYNNLMFRFVYDIFFHFAKPYVHRGLTIILWFMNIKITSTYATHFRFWRNGGYVSKKSVGKVHFVLKIVVKLHKREYFSTRNVQT